MLIPFSGLTLSDTLVIESCVKGREISRQRDDALYIPIYNVMELQNDREPADTQEAQGKREDFDEALALGHDSE